MSQHSVFNRITDRVRRCYPVSEESCVEETVDPHDLIHPDRLDILLKLYYVDARVRGLDMTYPTEVYMRHIEVMTSYTNNELGQRDKSSLHSFLSAFNHLIDSFQSEGFRDDISVIPVSADGIILDGAHRVACAIYFGSPVTILRLLGVRHGGTAEPLHYGYEYFKKLWFGEEFLHLAVLQYLKYSRKNIYMACLWPAACDADKRQKAFAIINQSHSVICTKEVFFSFTAFDRFIAQVYMNDDWVGSIANGFKGSLGKSSVTYKDGIPTTFILFEGANVGETLSLKQQIREIFGMGKHSVHITDTTEESRFLSEIVFNTNSLSFLEHGVPHRNGSLLRRINRPQDAIMSIASSMLMWGLTPVPNAKDDRLVLEDSDMKSPYRISDIANIPSAYFSYIGIRFVMPLKSVLSTYFKDIPPQNILNHLPNAGGNTVVQRLVICYRKQRLRVKSIVRQQLWYHPRLYGMLRWIKTKCTRFVRPKVFV
ncbi:MAG: hypothetical protein IJ764_05310 [Bacteroidales bacterium]|nr:hypothetical protein [Bacteroidales bacterium]